MSDFNPGFYGLRIRRLTSPSGVGGTTPVGTDAPFDNTDAGLPGDPDTMQEAIDALAALWTAGYPRPLMAFDPEDEHWYVVVDGDGTAVMVTGP